jgi:hypothetical protein
MFKTFTNPFEHVARKQFSAKERAEHFAKAEGSDPWRMQMNFVTSMTADPG